MTYGSEQREAARPDRKKAPFEVAVDKALVFLHNTQNADGSWTAGRNGKNTAITRVASTNGPACSMKKRWCSIARRATRQTSA